MFLSHSLNKCILGWDIDTHMMTLQLPEHCMNKLQHLIRPLLTQKRISLHKWRILFGTLRCSLPPLYGINHLFSSLQHAI